MVKTLLAANHRRQQDAPTGGQLPDPLENLLEAPGNSLHIAAGTDLRSDPGKEQAKKVIDLGDGPHGGLPPSDSGALLDRYSRRNALEMVDVGAVQILDKLPGIGRQAVEVASLSFGENNVVEQR